MTLRNTAEVGVVNPKFLYQQSDTLKLCITQMRIHSWDILLERLMLSDLDVYALFGPVDLVLKHYTKADFNLADLMQSYNISSDLYSDTEEFLVESIDKFEGFDIDWHRNVTLKPTAENIRCLDNVQRDWHSIQSDEREELIYNEAVFPVPVSKTALKPLKDIKAFVFIRLPIRTLDEFDAHRRLLKMTIFRDRANSIQGLYWSSHFMHYHCVVELSVNGLAELVEFVMKDLQGILPKKIETSTHIVAYPITTKQVPVSMILKVVPSEIERITPRSLDELLALRESPAVEFKSTLRWDTKNQKVNKDLERAVAKTVAAFMNTEGGTLVIGIADDLSTYGIESDISTIYKKDRDGFEQALMRVLSDSLGSEFAGFARVTFESRAGKTVCILSVQKSPQSVYLEDPVTKNKDFYIRVGNVTRALDAQAAKTYVDMHF